MRREDLIKALEEFGYSLIVPERRGITGKRVVDVLDSLAGHSDPRLVEGFPVVLANCAQKGIEVNIQALLSRYPSKSQKRRNREKLLVASSLLLRQEGLEQPEGLADAVESLEAKYGDLLSDEKVRLGRSVSLSVARLRNTLKKYVTNFEDIESGREKKKRRQARSFKFHMHLSALFSPKQKELILKKLSGEPFTKTEKEYYSRVVKKKLEALSNAELRKIATILTKK